MSSGGGGGGGGGMPPERNVPAAGPARAIGSYPQYNPLQYLGMTPGAQPPMPGVGAPIASYMPSVNGMNGFGGIPAAQLVQALMAGYAGVPAATQTTGAQAPGMSTMTPTTGTTPGAESANRNPYPRGSYQWREWERRNGVSNSGGTSGGVGNYIPGYTWGGEGGGSNGSEGGGDGSGSSSGAADNGMGMAGAGTDGSSGSGPGGMYANGGRVTRLANMDEWPREERVPDIRNAPTEWNKDPNYKAAYKQGGKVGRLSGPNPKGPDDGYAALDRGEYVVRASQAKKHGRTLARINAGKYGNKSL